MAISLSTALLTTIPQLSRVKPFVEHPKCYDHFQIIDSIIEW